MTTSYFPQQSLSNQNSDILNLMKQSKIYWQVKKQIINSILKPKQSQLQWQPSIQQIIKSLISTDNQQKITGLITNCLQKSTRRMPIEHDPNSEIQTYRQKWSDMITKQFNNIAIKIIKNQQYDEQDQSVNYTYDSSTLLQFLASIKIKNSTQVRDSPIFFFSNQIVKVSKYPQIRNKFSFLMSQENIIGQQKDNDLKQRQKKARKIADGQNISNQIQNYLCYGCVNGDRINVYKRYFECFYQYQAKKVDFGLYEKVWKPIIRLDCKQTLKDPSYFVFKQQMQKVYKQFICDKQVSQMVKIRQLSPDCHLDKYSPIHHILPCKSFSSYMAPFCYSSLSSQQIYQIFRQFYCNYLIHLNTISSCNDSILCLCVLFEELLFCTQKKIEYSLLELYFHGSFMLLLAIYKLIKYSYYLIESLARNHWKYFHFIVLVYYSTKNQSEIIQVLIDCLHEDIWIQTIRDFFKYHL